MGNWLPLAQTCNSNVGFGLYCEALPIDILSTVLSCEKDPSQAQIRVVVNDGVVPLTGIEGCPENKDGLCPVDTFVAAQKKIIAETDWNWSCYGNWTLPAGNAWTTTTGDAPKPPQ